MDRQSLAAMMLAGILSACGTGEEDAQKQTASRSARTIAFVENTTCATCHPKQYKKWSGSHHEQAMQIVTDKNVLGNFNDTSFTHFGITSRFFKKDGKFFVHTEGADGRLGDFEIKYTFGVEPLQQYLIEFPRGRLQSLTVAWDTQRKRWFHLYPDEKISHDDPLHWTGLYQNWNGQCAACHSTNLKTNYDLDTDTFKTTWSEINVSCQACHGPGDSHVKWAQALKDGESTKYENRGLVIDFKNADSRSEVENCARCHSRRHAIDDHFKQGTPLLDTYVPALLTEELYHADGQILEEVYVYGSFLQSKMYHTGVRCSDCHNPHSLKPVKAGNALCTQCHSRTPNLKFGTLAAKDYDSKHHHFHEADSPGAQCVNCHMPSKTYMVVDPRRDHSFRVPRPDLSVELGTPNACNDCHRDKKAQWANDTVRGWYGPNEQPPHFAEAFAAGRDGRPKALPKLIALAADTKQPTIIRATALDLLPQYGAQGTIAMVSALRDEDPLLRRTALRGLTRLGPEPRLKAAAPLLKDPIRAVRIEAARVLTSIPRELFNQSQRTDFDMALEEFKQAQMAVADQPSGHLNLGVMYASTGRRDLAEKAYLTALRKDPGFLPARFNLTNLYNAMGRNADAEQVLRDGIKRAPKEGELYYSLGLLLAEGQRYPEAATNLGKAGELMPARVRVHYNHGLALQHLGRRFGAETALLKAYRLDKNDPSVIQALAILYIQGHQWDRAASYARKLIRLYPNEPGPRRMLEQIDRARGSK
ncbi:MAG: tetratricopeptide repeat protein [Gammaproteobacteria bacterium]